MSVSDKLPDPDHDEEITVGAVATLADEIGSGRIELIDCRERSEWDFNRIPGARLIPLSSFADLAGPLIEAGAPTIVYCHHGMRSLQAARWLRAKGLRETWSMAGGIDLWSDRIDPGVPKY